MNNFIARRRLLKGAVHAALLAPLANVATLALAGNNTQQSARFVLVVLRGGLDGLAAVPAIGDAAFAAARGPLGQFVTPALTLDSTFALHPALVQMHALYGKQELAVVHAVGLPYRERSHFDAQQVLESGGSKPYELSTGWLGRALTANGQRAVAINTAVPLVLRGATQVDSWAPSVLPEPTADLLARLQTMYHHDADLGQALARARNLRASPGMTEMNDMGAAAPNRYGAVALARKAGELLLQPGGASVAVLELGGWDSHANQAAPNGALVNNLRTLDAMVAALRDALSAPSASIGSHNAWQNTVVVVASEFGREVAINGTQGTDHGTGGAAFVLGGAVRGGRVLADWPGLASNQRFEGRDLRITTDLRAVLRPVLAQHLGVPKLALDREVFPGSQGVRDLDLLRA